MKDREPMISRDDASKMVALALIYALLIMIGAMTARVMSWENAIPIYRPSPQAATAAELSR